MKKLLILSEKISKYLVAAVLIIIPLLPKFPLFKVSGTYVAVRFEDVLMLLLALILIPKIVLDFKNIWKDKIVKAILIFFCDYTTLCDCGGFCYRYYPNKAGNIALGTKS